MSLGLQVLVNRRAAALRTSWSRLREPGLIKCIIINDTGANDGMFCRKTSKCSKTAGGAETVALLLLFLLLESVLSFDLLRIVVPYCNNNVAY